MSNIIQQALKSIKNNISRSIMTTLGILIGIMSVTIIMSAGTGLEKYITDELASFGEDWINIEVKVPTAMSAIGAQITTLTTDDAEAVFTLPSIKKGYYGMLGQYVMSYRNNIKRLNTWAVSEEYVNIDNSELASGRFFTKEENDSAAKVVVLGSELVNRFFEGEEPIGKYLRIKNQRFRVIGTFKSKGSILPFFDYDNSAYIPIRTEQRLLQGVDHISYIIAQVNDPERIDDTAEEIKVLMRDRHEIIDEDKEDFRVTTVDETMDIVDNILRGIQILLMAIAGISLVVGGVGIMNVMYVAVSERTFEIGLRKAIGARPRTILLQFLLEAVIITLIGGILGIIMSFIGAEIATDILMKNNINLTVEITMTGILVATIFSISVGLIFGIYPAKKASAMDPIEALGKE